MYTRRKFLASTTLAAAGLTLAACRDDAQAGAVQSAAAPAPSAAPPSPLPGPLNTRVIPASGEKIPVIGGEPAYEPQQARGPKPAAVVKPFAKRRFRGGKPATARRAA